MVKNLPAMQATQVWSLGRSPEEGNGNPRQNSCLEKSMDRGRWLQSMGSQRVRHNWATDIFTFFSKSVICASVPDIYGRYRATLFLVCLFSTTPTFIKVPQHFLFSPLGFCLVYQRENCLGQGRREIKKIFSKEWQFLPVWPSDGTSLELEECGGEKMDRYMLT